jgi:hypothetical protein
MLPLALQAPSRFASGDGVAFKLRDEAGSDRGFPLFPAPPLS